MAMYGRVQPDKLGRPTRIWFSAHAAQVIGSGLFTVTEEDDRLLLRASPDGRYSIGKSRTVGLGAVLDRYNTLTRPLTNDPFPIRRVRDGVFELLLTEPNPELGGRSNDKRNNALPMELSVSAGLPERQQYTLDEIARMFALVSIMLGGMPTEAELRNPDELLAKLPGWGTVQSRFGSHARLSAFAKFQRAKLERQRLTPEQAHNLLLDML